MHTLANQEEEGKEDCWPLGWYPPLVLVQESRQVGSAARDTCEPELDGGSLLSPSFYWAESEQCKTNTKCVRKSELNEGGTQNMRYEI